MSGTVGAGLFEVGMAKININDTVRFRLTPHGEAIWQAYRSQRGIPFTPFNAADSCGRTEMQFWEMMHIFGPALYMGSEQIIVDNEVIV